MALALLNERRSKSCTVLEAVFYVSGKTFKLGKAGLVFVKTEQACILMKYYVYSFDAI